MKFSRRIFSALLLAAVGPLAAQDSGQPDVVLPEVSEAIEKFIANGQIAGAVTLVADRDSILHFGAAGFANLDAAKPMQPDSIFWIASMSKPITGACVMMLVDEGKLSLDDPIAKHLPSMHALRDLDGNEVTITVRHLLSHTSGMSEIPGPDTYTSKSLAEAELKYAALPVRFAPGSKWEYSQTGINTAARIVEVLSGITFDEFVEQRICKPLEMVDTTFYLSDEQLPRLALSYRHDADGNLVEMPIRLLAGHSPTSRERMPAANGGLFSTAADYARFCKMLLNNGEANGKQILSSASVKTMQTICTGELVTGFTPGNGWGVGCCVVREPQGISAMLSPGTFGHGGAYGTQAWIDPVKERIYLLMVQQSFPNSDDSPVRLAFQTAAAPGMESK